MEKEHGKSEGTKDRQEIMKRKDSKIKTAKGINVDNFKSDRD